VHVKHTHTYKYTHNQTHTDALLPIHTQVVGRIMLHSISLRNIGQEVQSAYSTAPRRLLAKEQRWQAGEEGEDASFTLQGYSRIMGSLAALEVAPSKVWRATG
jgi:hypothetical protein